MKRFWCTVCKRVIRVRKLPLNATESTAAHAGPIKSGTCVWHESKARKASMSRVRIIAGLGSTRKVSASSAKSKSKKG